MNKIREECRLSNDRPRDCPLEPDDGSDYINLPSKKIRKTYNKRQEGTVMKKHNREQIKYTMREITIREQVRLAKLLRLHKTQYA